MSKGLQERDSRLPEVLGRIGRILVSSLDLNDALGAIVDEALGVIGANVALLRLLDPPGEQLELHVARGVPEEVVRQASFRLGEGLAGRLLLDGKPLRGTNLQRDPRTKHRDLAQRFGWHSFLAVPLHLHQQPTGILFLIRLQREPFSDRDEELLLNFADYASLAIERSWLLHTIVQEKHESEAVIDASASGILVIDRYGHVVDMNPALEHLTGWTLREARGLPCCDVVGCQAVGEAKEQVALICPLRHAGLREERVFREYRIHARDGRQVPVEASYGLIRDERGDLARLVIVFRDISWQVEQNRARAEIVANVSHELRTPLALIKGYASTLLSPGVVLDQDKTRRFLQNVITAADRLNWMIDDLICASRLDMQELRLRMQRFDLRITVHKVLSWFQPHAPKKDLVAELPEQELWVWADPERVEQILLNLLSNAAKYSPTGTIIRVRSQQLGEPPRVMVHVADEGIGIDAEHLPRIFDRFYLTEESKRGIGLGLYICKGLVQAMGGEIWAVSERGQGSTFSFSLPVGPSSAPQEPAG